MSLAVGSRLGGYEVLALLGAGGMGEVYRARDTALRRDVAIKVLPESYSRDPDRLRRFELEAQAAAALNHPNILSVFHVGQQHGVPYIVTELLEGETLRDRLRRGVLSPKAAIDFVVQVAQGLAAAHAKGIAHRDLKPENVFVASDGRLKILDFGLAKLLHGQPSSGDAVSTEDHTDPAHLVGTVGYMAPEQVCGQPADARSDIFALGCVLYEMLSGTRAFQKPTAAETMTAILKEEPPQLPQSAVVPRSIHRVVQRCLEKSPERRFQSASDLAFALEALSNSEIPGTSAARPDIVRRVLPWTGVGLVLLTAVAGAWFFRRGLVGRDSAERVTTLEVRPLTHSGQAAQAAVSPDGRYVVYVKREQGQSELRLLQVATDRDVSLGAGIPAPIYALHFSPDADFIYFLRQLHREDEASSGVFRMAALGGPATPLATDARGDSVTVSPDGRTVAYIAQEGSDSVIVGIDAHGGGRTVLARRPVGRGFRFVEWSRSSSTLAAVVYGDDDMGLVELRLPGGTARDLNVTGWGAVGQPAWSSDGTTIYAPAVPMSGVSFQLWAFDARTGAARQVTSEAGSYQQGSLSSTATGELVANTSAVDSTVWVSDPEGRAQLLPNSKGEGWDGVLWLDGQIVTSDISSLTIHRLDGGDAIRLRSYSSIQRDLARCGEGRVAYWASDSQRKSHVACTDVRTGAATALSGGPADGAPACSRDGTTMVFLSCDAKQVRCSLARKVAAQQSVLHSFATAKEDSSDPSISPDGASVLFWSRRETADPYEWAAIVPISGGPVRRVRMPFPAGEVGSYKWNADYLRWAPDGRTVLFVRQDERGVGNIWSAPLDGGRPKRVTNFETDSIFAFDVSAEGRLLMSRGRLLRDVVLLKNVR
jgi:Tol biopolymer transport system component